MKDWKIATRIGAGFASVLILTVGLGIFACTRMLLMEQSARDIEGANIPSVIALDQIQAGVFRIVELLLDDALSADSRDRKSPDAEIDELHRSNAKLLQQFEALPASPEETAQLSTLKADRTAFWHALDDVREKSRSGNTQAAGQAAERLRPSLQKYLADLQRQVELHNQSSQQGLSFIQTMARSANLGILLVILLCIATAVTITLLIIKSIAAPLAQTVRALDRVAGGDLTTIAEVDTLDELGQMAKALNAALAMLRSTLQEAAESAVTSGTASRNLAAAAREIARGAQQQAASLEETSASLEQITAAVKVTAENARQASQLATGCRESAEKGQEVVTRAVGAMAEINTSSAKISDIIATINDIAFQTNLLAVNAAVEAARAGEEGRGFAVVAAEVRSLAQRSAEASKEIRLLIEDTLKKVEKGCELVNHSGATLEGIVNSVKRVTEIVGQIAAASSEQSTGVAQVNAAITQMDQVTQSNSTQTEELAATAQSFAQQGARLAELVHRFKLKSGPDDAELRARNRAPAHSIAHEELRREAARSAARLGVRPAKLTGHRAPPILVGLPPVRSDDSSFEEF